MRAKIKKVCAILVIGLMLVDFVQCLTIDNQLTVIRNDCYERLAIGEKLNPKDVDKTLTTLSTIQDCQMACTEEQEKCRSFSFGIGVKGNSTCELSKNVIKETPDLKPIGTITDVDFDLYIKKLGCKLVLTKDPPNNVQPLPDKPSPYDQTKPNDKPRPSNDYPTQKPFDDPYHNEPPYHYGPPGSKYSSDKPIRVQSSLIGIASNPSSSRPSYESQKPSDYRPSGYGIGRPYYPNRFNRPGYDRPSYYDYSENRPPFRPPFLNHPYDLDWDERRPSNDRLDSGIYGSRPSRPDRIPERPIDGYGSERPYPNDRPRPVRPLEDLDLYGHGSRPHRPDEIPQRPLGDSGSYGGRPHRPNDIPDRPINLDGYGQSSRPHRPHDIPERPLGDEGNYGSGGRPHRPQEIPERPYGSRPHRPDVIPQRPLNDPGEYGSRPVRPNDIPHRPLNDEDGYGLRPQRPDSGNYGSRPVRPSDIPHRPINDDSGYGSRPHRPDIIPQRPLGDYGSSPIRPHRPINDDSNYGSRPHRPDDIPDRPHADFEGYGSRPHRPHDIPDRPDDFYGSRPNRPQGDSYSPRPHRPDLIPDRPIGLDQIYGQRPHRPNEIPERPIENFDGYGSRPHRPHDIPQRPLGDYNQRPNRPDEIPESPLGNFIGYGQRPYRPHDIPERPSDSDGYGGRPFRPDRIPERPNRPPFGDYGPEPQRPYSLPRRPFEFNFDDRFYFRAEPPFSTNMAQNMSKEVNDSSAKSSNSSIESNYIEANRKTAMEMENACFRRVLAGKRVMRAFVRKAVPCERLEDCQRECSDEKRFVCEGFNYRLDPSGRGQGDCELLDLPLSRLDVRRDVYNDADYDYYERDRNSDAPDCKGQRYYGSYGDQYNSNGRYDDYGQEHHGGYYDYRDDSYRHGQGQLRPAYDDDYRPYDNNRRGGKNFDYHHSYQSSQEDYERYHGYHYKHHHSGGNDYNGYNNPRPAIAPPRDDYDYKPHYPPPPYDYKSYEPYLPHGNWKYERPFHDAGGHWDKYFEDRVKDKNYWGFNKHYGGWGNYGGSYGNFGAPESNYAYDYYNDGQRNNNRHYFDKKNFYVPHDNGGSRDWGQYGGSYGHGGQKWEYDHHQHHHKDSYDYWLGGNGQTGLLPPYQEKPDFGDVYLPPYDNGPDYLGIQHREHGHDHHHHAHGHEHHHHDQPEPLVVYYEHDYQNLLKDECSLRMVTGFRLHKGIVKKLIAVPNIYECELLCYKERDFQCNSYAFRYTIIPDSIPENCYLSDRDYRELDYYTDLEPDRDCDIYTMHNQNQCEQPVHREKYDSECFWRVRSGQRLDQRIVRDSLNVKSIIDCQIQCLNSRMFTCRAFSFRYGSHVIGGAIDNCQLTDWPFMEMDPRVHLVPEDGFELYERGSYGHGCEPNHFQIGNKPRHNPDDKLDHLCYSGYGSPARLLPQATKKSIRVETEAECKAECTQAREKSLFQCMSLSYRTNSPKGSPNCDLSDIVQRDLLSNVDYVADSDSWLFAWDIHNSRCAACTGGGGCAGGGIGNGGGGGNTIIGGGNNIIGGGSHHDEHDHGKGIMLPWFIPGYTWRIYSVGGLPCKTGSLCQENKVAGFWYCELEGREEHAWDYCCRPDHQCGYSEGFPYQWCYVGPGRTQWRTCNDRYYPYANGANDRFDQHNHNHPGTYLPDTTPPYQQAWSSTNSVGSDSKPPYRPGFRPDRPPPVSAQPPLDDYESQFSNNHFLDPPKPGGFGQSRHWPLSYLHKEMPPNDTSSDPKFDYVKTPKGRNIDSKYEAISNLIDVIKSNDLKKLQYQISNTSEKSDEILYVQIPLPTNFSTAGKSEKPTKVGDEAGDKLEAIDLLLPKGEENTTHPITPRLGRVSSPNNDTDRKSRVYTRSYITKTNRTVSNRRNAQRVKGTVELLPIP